ncbi:hypothetical protein ARMGADRAFT_1034517 [Armillaria gallica]|uniref:Uncharacterized protein n=1 Tax=Armillaria gallica TaxID=47427 RepID=A0A2H3DKE0_ARMGA|nr:hypothetical protein ARMGADRAFT_1034517 [Armillaria gallica]
MWRHKTVMEKPNRKQCILQTPNPTVIGNLLWDEAMLTDSRIALNQPVGYELWLFLVCGAMRAVEIQRRAESFAVIAVVNVVGGKIVDFYKQYGSIRTEWLCVIVFCSSWAKSQIIGVHAAFPMQRASCIANVLPTFSHIALIAFILEFSVRTYREPMTAPPAQQLSISACHIMLYNGSLRYLGTSLVTVGIPVEKSTSTLKALVRIDNRLKLLSLLQNWLRPNNNGEMISTVWDTLQLQHHFLSSGPSWSSLAKYHPLAGYTHLLTFLGVYTRSRDEKFWMAISLVPYPTTFLKLSATTPSGCDKNYYLGQDRLPGDNACFWDQSLKGDGGDSTIHIVEMLISTIDRTCGFFDIPISSQRFINWSEKRWKRICVYFVPSAHSSTRNRWWVKHGTLMQPRHGDCLRWTRTQSLLNITRYFLTILVSASVLSSQPLRNSNQFVLCFVALRTTAGVGGLISYQFGWAGVLGIQSNTVKFGRFGKIEISHTTKWSSLPLPKVDSNFTDSEKCEQLLLTFGAASSLSDGDRSPMMTPLQYSTNIQLEPLNLEALATSDVKRRENQNEMQGIEDYFTNEFQQSHLAKPQHERVLVNINTQYCWSSSTGGNKKSNSFRPNLSSMLWNKAQWQDLRVHCLFGSNCNATRTVIFIDTWGLVRDAYWTSKLWTVDIRILKDYTTAEPDFANMQNVSSQGSVASSMETTDLKATARHSLLGTQVIFDIISIPPVISASHDLTGVLLLLLAFVYQLVDNFHIYLERPAGQRVPLSGKLDNLPLGKNMGDEGDILAMIVIPWWCKEQEDATA